MAGVPANGSLEAIKNNIQLLFERPSEPVFMVKGQKSTVFQIPENLLPDRYKSLSTQIENRFGEEVENRITLKNITAPDITIPLKLGRHAQFSLFLPEHRQIAGRLVDIFMGMQSLDDLQSAAVFCREQVNPYLFNYALSVAMLHRTDTRDVSIPSIVQTFPDKYFDSSVFARAREEVGVIPAGSRTSIVIPRDYTATDVDPEHRVAYFREDLGINLHHWHWHLVYPFTSNNRAIVAKDRRGELFYYMHQQIIARYNLERFSNRLGRVAPLSNLRLPINEGYFPKLDSAVAGRSWPPRFPNSSMVNLNRTTDNITVSFADMDTWLDRFREAIAQGFVVDANQNRIQLTEETGIDILGDIMESSILNPNSQLYGDIHNMGHMLIGYCHDPDGRYLEGFGVIGDPGTAMRDPAFYRWHAYVDDLFQLHKSRLPRYSVENLSFPNVRIASVQVDVEGGRANEMQTHWQQSELDMSSGLDFASRGSVFVQFSHLQHQPFTYRIRVNNASRNQVFGTIRIFIAPRFDDKNSPLSFDQQRLLMVELDRFRVGLRQGDNSIVRRSTESSVTIAYERTFRNLANRPAANAAGEAQFNFCGCGWPQHMLIPKGTEQGMAMDLFVMVSNYADDRVNQDTAGICNDADSYCGIMNRRYPDRRSMGYPFDRVGRKGINKLTDFLTPNMLVQQVTIRHVNQTVNRNNQPVQPAQTTQVRINRRSEVDILEKPLKVSNCS